MKYIDVKLNSYLVLRDENILNTGTLFQKEDN